MNVVEDRRGNTRTTSTHGKKHSYRMFDIEVTTHSRVLCAVSKGLSEMWFTFRGRGVVF